MPVNNDKANTTLANELPNEVANDSGYLGNGLSVKVISTSFDLQNVNAPDQYIQQSSRQIGAGGNG